MDVSLSHKDNVQKKKKQRKISTISRISLTSSTAAEHPPQPAILNNAAIATWFMQRATVQFRLEWKLHRLYWLLASGLYTYRNQKHPEERRPFQRVFTCAKLNFIARWI